MADKRKAHKARGWRLTEENIRRLKPGQSLGDGRGGNGLRIEVSKRAAKWKQTVRIHGKRTRLVIGHYPEISIMEARIDATINARAIRDGKDPRVRKGVATVQQVAEEYMAIRHDSWSQSTRDQWEVTFRKHVNPVIGSQRIGTVKTADLMRVLLPHWPRPTGQQTKYRLRMVFSHAVNMNLIETNPVQGLDMRHYGSHVTKSFAHVPAEELRDVLAGVRGCTADASTRLLVQMVSLCATRAHEARHATWDEIDGDTWTIPVEHLKTRPVIDGEPVPLRIPLSAPALEVLAQARDAHGDNGLIFPSRTGKPMGRKVPLTLIKRHGGATLHGVRSSFKTWAGETGVSWQVSESALGHLLPGVGGVYDRGDYFSQRVAVMRDWADFLTD